MEEKLRVYTHTCMHLTRPWTSWSRRCLASTATHVEDNGVGSYGLWASGVQPGALSTAANYAEDTMSGLPACRSGAFSTPASHAEDGVRVR
jgi:hypothetical protein